MLFRASIAVPGREDCMLEIRKQNHRPPPKKTNKLIKNPTLNNIDDAEAKQRRYVIGSGGVNRNGPAHAVPNNHDWRWVFSIKSLDHFADIPSERRGKSRQHCFGYTVRKAQSTTRHVQSQ